MNVALVGYGRMNRIVEKLIEARADMRLAGVVDVGMTSSLYDIEPDINAVIDFSHPDNLEMTLKYCSEFNIACVIGTTGLTDAHMADVRKAAESAPVIVSANFSLGVSALKRAVTIVAQALSDDFDIEIVEAHHRYKADAPSGTALLLADAADPMRAKERVFARGGEARARGGEIGISSLRGGSVAGEHSVYFMGEDEVIELRHEALNRAIFARGAVRAARKLAGARPGLYTMEHIIWGDAL